jgi:hypothetical protein
MMISLLLLLLASYVNAFVVDGMKQQQQQPPFFIATTSACETEVPRQTKAQTAPSFESKNQQQSSQQSSQKQQQQQPTASMKNKELSWAATYTSVDALRSTYGANRHGVWGDLDARTARQLYHTLLPRALLLLRQEYLELYNTTSNNNDPIAVAWLAYRARVAAKLYARERCYLPARIAAQGYDGVRHWFAFGTFDASGMTFAQVYDKYAAKLSEAETIDQDERVANICWKIVERSCVTNERVDRMVLRGVSTQQQHYRSTESAVRDLEQWAELLEQDVRNLLQHGRKKTLNYKSLRTLASIKRRLQWNQQRQRRRQSHTEQKL